MSLIAFAAAAFFSFADHSKPDDRLSVRNGLELWLDAATISLPAGKEFTPVGEWPDLSGHGRDLVQKNLPFQPVRIVRAGGAVVRFDGIDDHLRRTKLGLTVADATVFVVASPRMTAVPFAGVLAFNAPNKRDYQSGLNLDVGPYPGARFSFFNVEGPGFGGVANLRTSEASWGGFHLLELAVAGDQVALSVDGKPEGRRPRRAAPISFDEATLGARFFNNGAGAQFVQAFGRYDVAEVLVYSRALGNKDRDSVRKYLQEKHRRLIESPAEEDDAESGRVVPVKNPPAVQVLVPGFDVRELPLKLPNINNVKYRPDGTLVALGYNGDIWLCRDTDGDGLEDKAERYWENNGRLRAPIGMDLTPPNYPQGQGVFVACKGKISLLVDADGDGKADKEILVASGWKEPIHNVDSLGVAVDPKDGSVYYGRGCHNFTNAYVIEKDGKARYSLKDETGTVVRVAPDLKSREIVATGVRFTVALRFNRLGDLFATDQEGATWLANGNPFDELLQIERGRHYGFPPRHPAHLPKVIDEPSVFDYTPQHQSTCGLNFNEPVTPGGPTFGPKSWEGDAFVAGYSRGKLYRTQLVKTLAGYVAQTQLLACLQMLTVDACVTPDGSLLVACHSGGPDWGSGPEGKGKLYKISYTRKETPQPVLAYASGPREVRVEFDRPVDPTSIRGLLEKVELYYGAFIRAGDRFESLWPGYAVVQMQKASPRRRVAVHSVQLTPDGRSLILSTDSVERRGQYALTLPTIEKVNAARGAIQQHPTIDLDFELSGCEAQWTSADGKSKWTGWLPHLDVEVCKSLTKGSAPHEQLWAMMFAPGELQLRTLLDLKDMLRPAVQPGSTIDYSWPAENVTLAARGGFLTTSITGSGSIKVLADGLDVNIAKPSDGPISAFFRAKTGGGSSPSLTYSTNEDSRTRALPLRRILPSWAKEAKADASAPHALPKEIVGGSWARGREVFFGAEASCAKCHTIHGEGGGIGPDLSNLSQRDYASVYRDVTQPSYALNPDHLTYIVLLKDGRTLTGVLRSEGSRLKVGDTKGNVVEIDRGEVESIKASNISTMPTDLLKPLGAARERDLFAFLLQPPPSMPRDLQQGRPKPRSMAEVQKILAGATNPPEKTRPLRLLLTAGPKDHGPGEHDYPAWQKAWADLLAAGKDVTVETAWEWPKKEQFEKADVLVLYQHGSWNADRARDVDGLLARGGGLVLIHWAVDGGRNAREFAQRIGLAGAGAVGFRHGEIKLEFKTPEHPIARNLDKLTMVDESYWKMLGDLPDNRVLATAVEDGAPRPQLWTLERGKGRVFVSIPGHYSWSFDDPLFRVVLLRGMAWSAHEPVDRFNDLVWPGADVAK